MKANTVNTRAHSLLKQGGLSLFERFNTGEERAWPQLQCFDRIARQHGTMREIVGVT